MAGFFEPGQTFFAHIQGPILFAWGFFYFLSSVFKKEIR